jgi:hypothetical protein
VQVQTDARDQRHIRLRGFESSNASKVISSNTRCCGSTCSASLGKSRKMLHGIPPRRRSMRGFAVGLKSKCNGYIALHWFTSREN